LADHELIEYYEAGADLQRGKGQRVTDVGAYRAVMRAKRALLDADWPDYAIELAATEAARRLGELRKRGILPKIPRKSR
jgi:hypothetical protein